LQACSTIVRPGFASPSEPYFATREPPSHMIEPAPLRPMNVSVVIATFNGIETLGEQLDALAEQDWQGSFEVLVSDNGSTDGTQALIQRYAERFPRLVSVDSSDVPGVSHARNVGASAATSDYLLFCDQDDKVGVGWLKTMASALECHPFVAARLEHRRLNPAWTLGFYGEPQRDELPAPASFLPYAWGCSIGVRRDLHIDVGGFDETFHEGGEDNDYCYRIQISGTPLQFVPAAVVHYRHRQRLNEIFRQSRGYGRESARLLKLYHSYGMQRSPQLRELASWLRLIARLPFYLRARERRAQWASQLGVRLGRLEGSIRGRYLAL
jgi:GT2 family glycosyltransferase